MRLIAIRLLEPIATEVGDKIIVLEVINIDWCLKEAVCDGEVIEYAWCCPHCDFIAYKWSALVNGFRNEIPYEKPDWDYCPICGEEIRTW